jgi:peptidoglycan-N-acetylmuramic acid deacetylase
MKKYTLLFVFTLFSVFFTQDVEANTTSYGWGLPRHNTGERPYPGKLYEDILSKHNAVYIDKINDKNLYLTFDAGFENGYTEMILDVLKEERVPATFFLTGQYLEKNEDIVKRMVKERHIIGNHTYYHPDLTKISKEKYKEDIELFEAKYFEITNKKLQKIMRPPSGTFSDRSLQIADELGYYNIFWSLAYKDWEINNQKGADYAYNSVMKKIHPGAIILLHNVSEDNAKALKRIIVDLKKQGYRFESIDNLIMAKEMYINYEY